MHGRCSVSSAEIFQSDARGAAPDAIDAGSNAGRDLPAGNVGALMMRTEAIDGLAEARMVLDESMQRVETPELVGGVLRFAHAKRDKVAVRVPAGGWAVPMYLYN